MSIRRESWTCSGRRWSQGARDPARCSRSLSVPTRARPRGALRRAFDRTTACAFISLWPKRSRRSTRPELDRHVAELAHHFFLAAPGGSAAKAVDYAARAAERAVAELAYEEAARLYEMAVTAHELQPGADALVRCELLLALGAALASANDMISAKETFVRAADVARSGGMADQLARAALGYGGSMVPWPADDARIVPLLEEALVAVGENGGVLRARLLARLACADQRPSLRSRGGRSRAAPRRPRDARLDVASSVGARLGAGQPRRAPRALRGDRSPPPSAPQTRSRRSTVT